MRTLLSPQSSVLSPRRSRRRAFTLIEILVVMSIMLILMGLFLAGMKIWSNNAYRAETLSRLEVLNAMLSELDSSGHNQFLSQWFVPADLNQVAPNFPGAFALNAAQFGNVSSTETVSAGAKGTQETLTVNGTPYIITCSRANALAYMTFAAGTYQTNTYPSWTSAFDGVTGSWFMPQPNSYLPSNITNLGVYYGIMTRLAILPTAARTLAGMPSASLAHVSSVNGVFTTGYPAGSTVSLLNTNPPPVVLDGWGNPILFCPGSGLAHVNGQTQTVGGLTDVYLNVNGSSASGPTTVSAPDGRPFFVSAGPDGDFAKGDDNIYSFSPQ
jgi:prepilin-type N-terminal cleavage/methylation domain-containing protein